jgi:hypothetical protein
MEDTIFAGLRFESHRHMAVYAMAVDAQLKKQKLDARGYPVTRL